LIQLSKWCIGFNDRTIQSKDQATSRFNGQSTLL